MPYDPNVLRGPSGVSPHNPGFADLAQAQRLEANSLGSIGQGFAEGAGVIANKVVGDQRQAAGRAHEMQMLQRQFALRGEEADSEHAWRYDLEMDKIEATQAAEIAQSRIEQTEERLMLAEQRVSRNEAIGVWNDVKPTGITPAESMFGEVTDQELSSRMSVMPWFKSADPQQQALMMRELRRKQQKRILTPGMRGQLLDGLMQTHEGSDASRVLSEITEGSWPSLDEGMISVGKTYIERYGRPVREEQFEGQFNVSPEHRAQTNVAQPFQVTAQNVDTLGDLQQIPYEMVEKHSSSPQQARVRWMQLQQPGTRELIFNQYGPITLDPTTDDRGVITDLRVKSDRAPWLGNVLRDWVLSNPGIQNRTIGKIRGAGAPLTGTEQDKLGFMNALSGGQVQRDQTRRSLPSQRTPAAPTRNVQPQPAPVQPAPATTDNPASDYDIGDDLAGYIYGSDPEPAPSPAAQPVAPKASAGKITMTYGPKGKTPRGAPGPPKKSVARRPGPDNAGALDREQEEEDRRWQEYLMGLFPKGG